MLVSKKDMAEIRVFVQPELRTQFKTLCVSQNKTMSEVLTNLMQDYILQTHKNTAIKS